MNKNIFINTSVDDIRSTLQCGFERISEKTILENISEENMNRARKTVVNMLLRALRLKRQKATKF